MRAVDIIIKKRDGEELTSDEIEFLIREFARDEITDYQMSAWAMAVVLNGMTPRETTDLTLAMVDSGDTLDLSGVVPFVIDKHSTGGVGDKTTLVVGPLVSACGLPVGKMSGRGLGFSGGTLDKMESIPGYRCDLSTKEFLGQLGEIGIVLTGQTVDLAPADGKLYSLRDVTGTVASVPLIASSIMSKKIAGGAQAIVLDVKAGVGAFMQSVEEAVELAELMVEIAKLADRQATAVISDMNQPLGRAVGNALEVKEAILTLKNNGPDDFRNHCFEIAKHMLLLGGVVADEREAYLRLRKTLEEGKAWEQFRRLVAAQGGDLTYIDDMEKLPKAAYIEDYVAPRSGYLEQINARIIGETAVLLGAGRAKKGDPIDHAVGIIVSHKVGDFIRKGEVLFTIHANEESKIEEVENRLMEAHIWNDKPVDPYPLFYRVID